MPGMRNPRSHFAPLAIGAPEPLREIPVTPMRMIHFFDPSNEKMLGRLPDPTVHAVSVERRLSRFAYIAEKRAES